MATSFEKKVFAIASKIPKGKVSTYALVAKAAGKPLAARAAGNALNKSPGMPACPCHRVVKSDGSMGGFAHGSKRKAELLRREGVKIKQGRIENFEGICYKFPSSHSSASRA